MLIVLIYIECTEFRTFIAKSLHEKERVKYNSDENKKEL